MQQASHGDGVRHRPRARERVVAEAEDVQHRLRGIRDPFADRDERPGPGQHRRDGRAQQREGRISPPSRIAGIGDMDQESAQVSDVVRDNGDSLGAQLPQRGGDGR
ncbi:hypothetical protein P8A18_20190 [Streptomyces castrisilvae]|uniref:Uncharacterized protein n=1 Tax=Streptomyces castrisilvae TaxID=3033811 RepID=A0ABY9HM31_9ACTN|nr:hypothetical protein [Streptomyces sp. Mut1]WLQ35590.1 hypothetical protein P8A18_20165 [Streptomyces sp. Mut1]WLQ35595.1 hypothetical protein P8A18_20190 [Streptomyces sp. Mut1]